MAHATGDIVGDKYKLEQALGSGAMGSVWIAVHINLGTQVAIKFMNPALVSDDTARVRFDREAKAAATLRSPHVVQIFDYGFDSGAPYIAMELLEGRDLKSRLQKRGKIPLDEATIVLLQACKALQLAADAGIVHRDLKPANIFMACSGDEEVVKVLDFGLAKPLRHVPGSDQTATGALVGSPYYMSPEQARGAKAPIDHRSDLWSMTVILFQAITGKVPFPGGDFLEVLWAVCNDPIPKPSEIDDSLPEEIDRFFEQALERDPDLRFQSAREMALAFSRVVAVHLGRPDLAGSGVVLRPSVRPDKDSLEVMRPTGGQTKAADDEGAPASSPAKKLGQAETVASDDRVGVSSESTLEAASGSFDATVQTSEPTSRKRSVWIGLVVAATIVVGAIVWLGLGKKSAPAANTETAYSSVSKNVRSAPQAESPAPATTTMAATATVTTATAEADAASSEPSASSSAVATASAQPSAIATSSPAKSLASKSTKPIAKPPIIKPTGKPTGPSGPKNTDDQDPVLGF